MMRPQPFSRIPGIAARMAWNTAERLIAITASQRSGGKSSILAVYWMPALLTRMSSAPCSRCVFRTSASTSDGRDKSAPS